MVQNVLSACEKINVDDILVKDADLSGRNTARLPSKAEWAAWPKDYHEIRAALAWAKERNLPVTVLGGCSNSILSRRGIKGLAIMTTHLTRCHINGELFCVRGGLALNKAVDLAIDAGLSGLELLSGIPGTVGGAVWGNAGSNGRQISDTLYYVDYLTLDGEFHRLGVRQEEFGYRTSPFQTLPCIIYEAGFRLRPTRQTAQLKTISEGCRSFRKTAHQYTLPSAGCTFKNPEGQSAGKLIDSLGLKTLSVGGASVSPWHANFLVNNGTATGEDFLALAEKIKSEVKAKTGITLSYEVRFIGDYQTYESSSDRA